MVVAHQNLSGLCNLITPLSGMVCYLWVRAFNNQHLPIKFEVSISTHYESMKQDTKCGK